MIRHVVCFRWKEGTTPEQVDDVAAAPRELRGADPEIRLFKCGPEMDVNAGSGLRGGRRVRLDRRSDQLSRPLLEHQRVITDLIAPIRADRAAVQFDAG